MVQVEAARDNKYNYGPLSISLLIRYNSRERVVWEVR